MNANRPRKHPKDGEIMRAGVKSIEAQMESIYQHMLHNFTWTPLME
jgi:hypothetical protein